jgi:transcriptional regulator with XRE-family HTH domain
LSLLGLTDQELAAFLGISCETLYSWKLSYPEFRESIARGKIEADARVAEALYRRACGYSHPAVKIFMPAGADAPVYAPYTEHHPPDVNAGFRWLYNRQPDRWRERKQVEHIGSLEHRLAQMTDEERLARLRELRAKAGMVIEGEAEEVEE